MRPEGDSDGEGGENGDGAMTKITFSQVEAWLDNHPQLSRDYFLRKVDLSAVNAWLVHHGFLTIDDYVTCSSRRGSSSSPGGGATCSSRRGSASSPGGGQGEEAAGGGNGGGGSSPGATAQSLSALAQSPSTAQRRGSASGGSKRCLRHDFARSKSRSVFRTQEVGGACAASVACAATSSRRSSLKDMRKYTSLPPSAINMLSLLIESKIRLPRSAPAHPRAAKREQLRAQGERAFFEAAARDVATELELKALSRKAVDNLAVLLRADGASLFLVERARAGRPMLVSKVFDVHSGVGQFLLAGAAGDSDNEVQVPWGAGVLGHVADTGETVNLQVACEDPRFDDQVDRVTGYHTDSLLCMPVRNAYEEIIAVAQVINKSPDLDGGCFTAHDEKLFESYLQFVAIAITNAQIVEASRQEYERNRNLLEVVHDLFEEQTSLEQVILKTMQRAQRLLSCERAAVLLLEDAPSPQPPPPPPSPTAPAASAATAHVTFSKLFQLAHGSGRGSSRQPSGGGGVAEGGGGGSHVSRHVLRLAERVALSGEVLNVAETLEVEKGSGENVRSLLAMPIRNRHYQTIGVATIVNKLNGLPFDDNDEQLFEAFSIFCGLGIHNTLMYSEVEKAMARQKVAIEVLSYHATASNKEVEALLERGVARADELDLFSLSFNDFSLSDDQMVLAAVSMFLELGLVKRFAIERETLYRFLITVKKNYRDVPYHNWRHAFNVAQVMFAMLMGCEMKGTFSDIEVLGMFVGCLCHDLDHRGTNNAFQEKAGSALVLLYGTTNTMEHHHFNHAVMILSSEGHNVLAALSADDYSKVMQVLKQSILATDLSVYFEQRARFFALVESRAYSWSRGEQRRLLRAMLMTAADLAAACKPWRVQRRAARLVAAEFLQQGERERHELHLQPQGLMDRARLHELPALQGDWIRGICLPLYQSLGQMNPKLSALAEGARANIAHWEALAAGVANGHGDQDDDDPEFPSRPSVEVTVTPPADPVSADLSDDP